MQVLPPTLARRWPWLVALTLVVAGLILYQTAALEGGAPVELLPEDPERAAGAEALLSAGTTDPAAMAAEQARLGRELYEGWRFREAREALELALELDPSVAGAYCDLGLVELRQPGDVDRAAALFEKAMELDPTDGRFPLGLAGALGAQVMESGSMLKGAVRIPRIRELLESSVELDPESIDSQSALMHFYLMVPGFLGGSVERAQTHAEALAALHPAEGLAARALIESHGERYDEAERLYRESLASEPDYGPVRRAFGAFLMRRERFEEAREVLLEVTRIDPGDPEAHDQLGRAHHRAGDPVRAEACFRRALELNPDSLSARVHLGGCLADAGDEAGARRVFSEVCALSDGGHWTEQAREWLEEHGG